ncbi:hypothetical protein AB0C61_13560 [Streptomyces sp. NPDC048680]|uniref:hypothetical protein n=1 Tax=Streptomyces sp. NPDC048680 TaxID=3155492 RepID=UPI00341D3EDF
MSSSPEVKTTTRPGCRFAITARAASMAYSWPCRPVSLSRRIAPSATSLATGSTTTPAIAQSRTGFLILL